MDTFVRLLNIVLTLTVFAHAVPPEACFANFRWEDCGKPPTRVIYYGKPGSKCEVGIWRGCLPNPNMFSDEYSCINTCIFVSRGGNMDALDVLKDDEEEMFDTTTDESQNATTVSNSTDTTDVTNSNTTATSDSSSSANSTEGDSNSTTTDVETNSTAEETGGETTPEETATEAPAEE